ncbi:MAG: flagellar M-ring protein FliF [Nitrospirae bacterium]|nr:flagellar M-ring protein FliF [Magnetococcales bacterium]HAT50794.1 flagellar M-ring protein FliF [Alphaproteobacteria bacterium]
MAESATSASTNSGRSETPAEAFSRFLENLPLGGRNGLIVAVISTVIALTAVIWFITRPSYKTLFSSLPEVEAGRVVEQLVKMNVPYQLGVGGSSIEVPADRVYDLRLEMATLGLPKKGTGVGFEVFDQGNLVGMTDFMQRMNYQRALQGELARTIESIDAVSKARVHLVMPKQSLFVTEERPATASVIMELVHPLNAKQAEGIVHLVAAAVEGLDESQVTLLDQKGNLVAGGQQASKDGRMGADESMDMQKQVEKSLENRAQAMLDKIIGINASGVSRSIVRITADLDLSQVERQEETFNPDGQVARSEQTSTESSKGEFGVGGTPGVRPNDANDRSGAGASGSNQTRNVERETINYEISKKVEKTVLPVGTIKRISVAVLVDAKLEKSDKPDAAPQYVKRTEEEMSGLKKIVEQAVGFRADRGDTIEVSETPFAPMVASEEEGIPFWKQPAFWMQVGLVLTILLVLFIVLRPMVQKLMENELSADNSGVPAAVAELEEQLLAEGIGTLPTEQPIRMRVPDRNIKLTSQMIGEHVEDAREIIRSWLALDN